MIDHNHFICHFIFGGHLLNIPIFFIVFCSSCTCKALGTPKVKLFGLRNLHLIIRSIQHAFRYRCCAN